jgi:acyl-coenzyme A synthetase/AMP-(fatty) acid ligase
MDNQNSSVKRFIGGGEKLKVSIAADIYKSFCGDIEIYNEYGPTETVVGCMIYKYNFEKDTGVSVPIGVPADNVQVYILDRNLKPLPEGSTGEIFISGDGVSRGYLNKKELTQENFIQNPYIEGKIMYKTGDLAKFLDNRVIEYVGRADEQVKIRGYRIELSEIEKQILNYESIVNAVVVDKLDVNGDKYLCAYIVTSQEVSINELRNYLLKHLPQYMVPFYYVSLDEIPLTKNGKVDVNLLPVPNQIKNNSEVYVHPRNEKEEKLVETLKGVLNNTNIGMKDNF